MKKIFDDHGDESDLDRTAPTKLNRVRDDDVSPEERQRNYEEM